jgi:ABC-type sugar transport system ATPase subunit
MELFLDNLSKHFGKVKAVDGVNLKVADGEFVALLGPSGCGKTTTLLMIAGIYKPTSGYIRFGEKVVNDLLPKDRKIGMVFQSYALYPTCGEEHRLSLALTTYSRRGVAKTRAKDG